MIRYKIIKQLVKFVNKEMYMTKKITPATYDLKALAKHMANHNTPFSEGVIYSILTDMTECLREFLLNSRNVKIDNLGIFSLAIKGASAEDVEDAGASQIKTLHMNVRGTGNMKQSEIAKDCELQLDDTAYTQI